MDPNIRKSVKDRLDEILDPKIFKYSRFDLPGSGEDNDPHIIYIVHSKHKKIFNCLGDECVQIDDHYVNIDIGHISGIGMYIEFTIVLSTLSINDLIKFQDDLRDPDNLRLQELEEEREKLVKKTREIDTMIKECKL